MTDTAPPHDHSLSKLWQAIKDNTKGDLFWIGEILLSELRKETGFTGWCPICGMLGHGECQQKEKSE